MSEFNPKKFGEWLSDAFRKSHYKSLAEVADIVGVSRTTMSMYAGAKPQTTSNKPSRPKREICIKLAKAFEVDEAIVLSLGGHASTNPLTPEIERNWKLLNEGIAHLPTEQQEQIKKEFERALNLAVNMFLSENQENTHIIQS